MKQTQYELSERVLNTEGSMRAIGEKLGISKGYVSMLKKVRLDCATRVIDYWMTGEISWALARALSRLPKKEQLPIMRGYISDSRGKTKGQQKAVQVAAMSDIKKARGLGPDPKLEFVRQQAIANFQNDDCQINDGKVEKVEGGYWVPASVFVYEEEGE